jgi:hypothetical protein
MSGPPEYNDPRWFKSSHSNGEGGDCVTVIVDENGAFVRDSKLREASPVFSLSPAAWAGLLAAVRPPE